MYFIIRSKLIMSKIVISLLFIKHQMVRHERQKERNKTDSQLAYSLTTQNRFTNKRRRTSDG